MIVSIESRGMLVRECSLPGESRADDVFPAHPNAIQISKTRWLLLYATRGFQGVDDDRSIVYQIRANSVDGPVLHENWLARCVDDWQPDPRFAPCRKEQGHPVAFGVPRGAVIKGAVPPHANLFVAKWRVVGKQLEGERASLAPELRERTQGVEWVQFRLNDAENDIEILQPAVRLRQLGYEEGQNFCAANVRTMNQSFVQAVPLNSDANEWGDVNHFDGGGIAAMKYRYDAASHRYQWTQLGPLLGQSLGLFEASLACHRGAWVIAARQKSDTSPVWFLTKDLFGPTPESVHPIKPNSLSPLATFAGPDDALYLLTGDRAASPHRNARDPLYCFEIDPEAGFGPTRPSVVFDSVAAGLPIRVDGVPRVDMGKLVAHAGGSEGFILHRVRSKSVNFPGRGVPVINQAEKDCSGIYYARARYDRAWPGQWEWDVTSSDG